MVGAVVRSRIAVGEPVTDGAVVKPGDRGFLAAVLNPGMRAVSVPITPTSANSGLIFPGDRVDLILTQTLIPGDGEGGTRRVSETVLKNLRIIAMGVETGDDAEAGKANERAKTATLEVTPGQAETVALLTELGKLSLSLRSLAADGEAESSRADRRGRKLHLGPGRLARAARPAGSRRDCSCCAAATSEDVQVQQGSK